MTDKSQGSPEHSNLSVPSELEGKGFRSAATTGKPSTEGIVSVANADQLSEIDNLESYAKHLHTYIREYISLADRKAAFIFTIGAALLTYLYESGVAVSWLKSPTKWAFSEFIVFLAISGLSLSCLLAVSVVYPRLAGSKRGMVYWASVAEFETATEFSDAAQQMVGISLTKEILRHGYELAHVCKKKYRMLNWALRIGAVGAVATIIYLAKG